MASLVSGPKSLSPLAMPDGLFAASIAPPSERTVAVADDRRLRFLLRGLLSVTVREVPVIDGAALSIVS